MLGTTEIIIIALVVIIFLFGSKKILEFARNLGKAKSEFEKGKKEGEKELEEKK